MKGLMNFKKMGKIQRLLEYYGPIFRILLLTLMPLIMCYIVCLRDGISLGDIYLPNSKWNDEVLYYKITEGVAAYNGPLGYFGYNGSSAQAGHFGAWSPVIFVFYIIWAKTFGWSLLSPVYCNIILMTIAMLVFAVFVRPTKKQTLFLCLFYASCSILTRYVLSGMTEMTVYAILIMFIGIAVKACRSAEDVFKVRYVIALNSLAVFLVLMRPYWILLFAVPAWYWYKKGRRKAIFFEMIISIVSIVSYFFIAHRYCAQYLFPIINLDWLKLLFTDPVGGIYNILHILVSSVWNLLQSMGEGIIQGEPMGAMYAVFMLILIYFIYCIKNCSSEDRAKQGYSYGLISFLVMLLAIFYLYDLKVGSRHLLGFILAFIMIFPLIERKGKRHLLFLTMFIWLFCARASDEYTYQLPVRTEMKEAEIAQGMEELERAEMLDRRTENAWDNTIIWLYSDETNLDFTYLYALPKGMGINLCFKDYVVANFDLLKAKYIITNAGEEIDLLCKDKKKELKAEYANVHIWKLR